MMMVTMMIYTDKMAERYSSVNYSCISLYQMLKISQMLQKIRNLARWYRFRHSA